MKKYILFFLLLLSSFSLLFAHAGDSSLQSCDANESEFCVSHMHDMMHSFDDEGGSFMMFSGFSGYMFVFGFLYMLLLIALIVLVVFWILKLAKDLKK